MMASWFVSLRLILFLSIIPSAKNTDLGLFDDNEGKRSIYYRLWKKNTNEENKCSSPTKKRNLFSDVIHLEETIE